MAAFWAKHPTTLNAQLGAITMALSAIGTGVLAVTPTQLAPLSLLFLLLATFGLWALCDEMGMKKPLVRGAFVAFAFATGAKAQGLLHTDPEVIVRYYIFYAFSVLLALLLWSIAFLHRQKELKIVGVLGATATVTPIILLITGHIIVGIGGAFGVTALYSIADRLAQSKFAAIDNIDLIFACWTIAASALLWRGHIRDSA
ncbi:MAG: hypothetical protein COA52_05975 [Hyphomicrobiales bacterium]|nr:hypothetical protein [Hyphomicrobiales bacterium]PCJ93965.1 MAG: hypothetical protein COA52_05975 [Hyphomicrobiales bacterium]